MVTKSQNDQRSDIFLKFYGVEETHPAQTIISKIASLFLFEIRPKKSHVSQTMVQLSEPSINKALDIARLPYFPLLWIA